MIPIVWVWSINLNAESNEWQSKGEGKSKTFTLQGKHLRRKSESFGRQQNPRPCSQGCSFHACRAQHFCGPAMGVYTPAHCAFESSTFIYEKEEKTEVKNKKTYPRRAKQLNFFSSVTRKWEVDAPPWRDNTKSLAVSALWSPGR